jgi:hypothetical protein
VRADLEGGGVGLPGCVCRWPGTASAGAAPGGAWRRGRRRQPRPGGRGRGRGAPGSGHGWQACLDGGGLGHRPGHPRRLAPLGAAWSGGARCRAHGRRHGQRCGRRTWPRCRGMAATVRGRQVGKSHAFGGARAGGDGSTTARGEQRWCRHQGRRGGRTWPPPARSIDRQEPEPPALLRQAPLAEVELDPAEPGRGDEGALAPGRLLLTVGAGRREMPRRTRQQQRCKARRESAPGNGVEHRRCPGRRPAPATCGGGTRRQQSRRRRHRLLRRLGLAQPRAVRPGWRAPWGGR